MKFRNLRADEIDCRVASFGKNGKGCSLLLYKDARCDMNILDETVFPENWQRRHEVINGNLFCNVGIKCDGEWIWKQDVGTESMTEKEKGQASDSFKRACFNWGIGRELYTAPFIWITDVNIEERNGKPTTYDKFVVKSIEYSENVISKLVIINEKTHTPVFTFGSSEPKKDDVVREVQAKMQVLAHINKTKMSKENIEKICKYYKVDSINNMTEAQCLDYMSKLEENK